MASLVDDSNDLLFAIHVDADDTCTDTVAFGDSSSCPANGTATADNAAAGGGVPAGSVDAAAMVVAVGRTFQSEEDFQFQKAIYSAKVDQGSLLGELVRLVPGLERDGGGDGSGVGHRGDVVVDEMDDFLRCEKMVSENGDEKETEKDEKKDEKKDENRMKKKIENKKIMVLLGYVVGEMYYDRKYEEILALCERVRRELLRDSLEELRGLRECLERWEGRCRARITRREKGDDREREKEKEVEKEVEKGMGKEKESGGS